MPGRRPIIGEMLPTSQEREAYAPAIGTLVIPDIVCRRTPLIRLAALAGCMTVPDVESVIKQSADTGTTPRLVARKVR